MILHAYDDPWDGCVVRIIKQHTTRLLLCRLPGSQSPYAKGRRRHLRLLSVLDLF